MRKWLGKSQQPQGLSRSVAIITGWVFGKHGLVMYVLRGRAAEGWVVHRRYPARVLYRYGVLFTFSSGLQRRGSSTGPVVSHWRPVSIGTVSLFIVFSLRLQRQMSLGTVPPRYISCCWSSLYDLNTDSTVSCWLRLFSRDSKYAILRQNNV